VERRDLPASSVEAVKLIEELGVGYVQAARDLGGTLIQGLNWSPHYCNFKLSLSSPSSWFIGLLLQGSLNGSPHYRNFESVGWLEATCKFQPPYRSLKYFDRIKGYLGYRGEAPRRKWQARRAIRPRA
jgi:hypothetical protein